MSNGTEPLATPSVLMELREERQVVTDGYQFLDEKRLLLAAEILRQLEHYRQRHESFMALHRDAAEALAAAIGRHGLEGVQLQPEAPLDNAPLRRTARSFLGVQLVDAELQHSELPPEPQAVDPSPEVCRCRELFRALLGESAALAGVTGNLERLQAEYRRTERRARALEDVLLPELEQAVNSVAARLEELDQEEAVRTHLHYNRDHG